MGEGRTRRRPLPRPHRASPPLEEILPTPAAEMPSDADIAVAGIVGLSILLLIALIFVKGRRMNVAILALCIALLLGGAVAEALV